MAVLLAGGAYELLGVGFESVFIFLPFCCIGLFFLALGKVTKDVTKATVEEVGERRRFRRAGIPILRIERTKRQRH